MHRLIAPIVFSTVMIIGTGISLTLYDGAEQAREMRAEDLAGQLVDRVSLRLSQHFALLRATNAFFSASPSRIKHERFARMIDGVGLQENYPGLQGIGFAEAISVDQDASMNALLQRDYDYDVKVWPETDQSERATITLLEPLDARNHAAIGYDMFSEAVRREAIQKAYETGELVASGPVELVQEITSIKQSGFLVYSRYLSDQSKQTERSKSPDDQPLLIAQKPLRGVIYAPLRAGDLFLTALGDRPRLPIAVKAQDLDDKSRILFESAFYDDKERFASQVTRVIDVAGRKWVLDIRVEPKTALNIQDIAPYTAIGLFFLMASMLAWITHSQLRAVQTAHTMQRLTQKNLSEKDLLLQEMKHRIKNSIARILAMARQTAHHSDDLDDFSESFTARLQAMANAQDALTRSHWQRADLAELLTRELGQVLGDSQYEGMISGPTIELDESMVQAFALTFHELATNALKYSDVAQDNTALRVSWSLEPKGKEQILSLVWQERSETPVEAPSHKGFGTKLIDANIRGELRGAIERRYEANGLLVLITVPITAPREKKSAR
ncbi:MULTISPECIES: CHASE domain-containing protein [Cohaesibacter]|uniref:CHASE domain-containing protein n=1 Tax=Cohaesibacter TaxID=655352 RepID=UPI000DE9B1AB|nr:MULTISPECIES: CHASE domain-containing protein [Cohaesibacter]TLP49286.1 histidine kinase [Cohaesibacter sp. CAU 1516]